MSYTLRTCKTCNQTLSKLEFPPRSYRCRPCTNEKARQTYHANLDKSRAKSREAGKKCYAHNSDKYLERSRAYYAANKHVWQERYGKKFYSPKRETARLYVYKYLKEHPCVECGEDDPIVLEFDHINAETKTATVSKLMLGGSIDELISEIAKCQVLCSNCHKRKTARQQNWVMLKLKEQDI